MAAEGSTGYNAATDVMEDLLAAGIIDPAKVTKTALLNASSIAGLMITTEALVSEVPETETAAAVCLRYAGRWHGWDGLLSRSRLSINCYKQRAPVP